MAILTGVIQVGEKFSTGAFIRHFRKVEREREKGRRWTMKRRHDDDDDDDEGANFQAKSRLGVLENKRVRSHEEEEEEEEGSSLLEANFTGS